jgi:hypothetical protein
LEEEPYLLIVRFVLAKCKCWLVFPSHPLFW